MTTVPPTHLLSPTRVGPVRLRNRVVMLPHFTMFAHVNGTPSERQRAYYRERARGGVGLIITEGMPVHPTGAMLRSVHAWESDAMTLWADTVEECHLAGAKIFAQLTHYGNQTFTEFSQLPGWAPSAVPDPAVGHVPKAMTARDIAEVLAGFAAATANARSAGFDGVELKVAHDGLLRQFLSPQANHRDDDYGGSEENRLRLTREAIAAAREAAGPGMAVGVRLCLDEGVAGGYGLEDGLRFATGLAQEAIDYISSDLGTWAEPTQISPSMDTHQGFALGAIARLKNAVKVPVIAYGRIKTPAQAEEVVASGTADLVGMARQLIADPDWVAKVIAGRADQIRPCIACNQTCNGRLFQFQPIGCIHNPAAGHEATLGTSLATAALIAKRVVVIGGGPAGLKVAEVAADRGHDVVLIEAAARLGGQVRLAGRGPHRGEWVEIVDHLVTRITGLGVDVRLGEPADAEVVAACEPDVVVVATGARPGPVPLPTAGHAVILDQWRVLDGNMPCDQQVVLFDQGSHAEGATLVSALAESGNAVTWVTPAPMVGMGMEFGTLLPLRRRLAAQGVVCRPEHIVTNVDGGTVGLLDIMAMQPATLPEIDAVVLAGNKVVNDPFATTDWGVPVFRVGDCVSPRSAEVAIREAARVGADL